MPERIEGTAFSKRVYHISSARPIILMLPRVGYLIGEYSPNGTEPLLPLTFNGDKLLSNSFTTYGESHDGVEYFASLMYGYPFNCGDWEESPKPIMLNIAQQKKKDSVDVDLNIPLREIPRSYYINFDDYLDYLSRISQIPSYELRRMNLISYNARPFYCCNSWFLHVKNDPNEDSDYVWQISLYENSLMDFVPPNLVMDNFVEPLNPFVGSYGYLVMLSQYDDTYDPYIVDVESLKQVYPPLTDFYTTYYQYFHGTVKEFVRYPSSSYPYTYPAYPPTTKQTHQNPSNNPHLDANGLPNYMQTYYVDASDGFKIYVAKYVRIQRSFATEYYVPVLLEYFVEDYEDRKVSASSVSLVRLYSPLVKGGVLEGPIGWDISSEVQNALVDLEDSGALPENPQIGVESVLSYKVEDSLTPLANVEVYTQTQEPAEIEPKLTVQQLLASSSAYRFGVLLKVPGTDQLVYVFEATDSVHIMFYSNAEDKPDKWLALKPPTVTINEKYGTTKIVGKLYAVRMLGDELQLLFDNGIIQVPVPEGRRLVVKETPEGNKLASKEPGIQIEIYAPALP